MKQNYKILLLGVLVNIYPPKLYALTSAQIVKHAHTIATLTRAANDVGIPPELLIAVAWTESNLRTKHVTHVDGSTPSYGPLQIKLETARWVDKVYHHKHLATPTRLENTYLNAYYAAKYIKLLLSQYNNNWEYAIEAYNIGHAVHGKSQYVHKVMKAVQKEGTNVSNK
jgi:soluble lytic murein transglycosylase-like protein